MFRTCYICEDEFAEKLSALEAEHAELGWPPPMVVSGAAVDCCDS